MFGFTLIKKKKLQPYRLVELLEIAEIDLIFDVGANVGQYATKIRQLGYKKEILSFEPTTAAYRELQRLADADPKWHLAPQIALGETCKEAVINVSRNSDMSSVLDLESSTLMSLPGSQIVEKEKIKVETLDALFDDYRGSAKTPFLKVDTQGSEFRVLQGAEQCLKHFKGVQLELSLLPLYTGEKTFEEISLWMRSKGFEPYMILPGYYSRELNRQMQLDIVFFKKEGHE